MNSLKDFLMPLVRPILLIFWRLHRPLVAKNSQLKNSHIGETCFIFANGASLKFYDISKLPQNPGIVCGYSLIDKRTDSLNIKYYVTTDSYCLYSYVYNTYPHVRKFQRSKVRPLFSYIFKKNKHITTFVNITSFYSTLCRRENVSYYHHFGDKNSFNHDLAGSFSNCRGALDTMLGIAKYLGFSRAVLMGCDYLGTPPVMGHMYADSEPFFEPYDNHLGEYRERIKLAAKGIDVTVILPEGVTSPDFEFDSYENYFKLKKEYRENKDFIDDRHLEMLRDAARSIQTQM